MTSTRPRDLERELQEHDGTWPDCWKPKEGEVLVGRILRVSTGPSAYGPVRTVILQKDDGERVSVWLSSTVLLALFREQKPKPGERIGLKFIGRHETKNYKRYALVVDRPAEEVSFDPLGGEVGDDPDPAPYAAAAGLRAADPFDFGDEP